MREGYIAFERDDGGRAAAGYKGDAGDCVTRAVAIATRLPYTEVYRALSRPGKSARNGVERKVYEAYLESLGWKWYPCVRPGDSRRVHLDEMELPRGRIICRLSKHMVAVIDGVLHDTYDCSRESTRMVYGYFKKD